MLGKLSVPGVILVGMIVGQRPTALAVGAGAGCLDIFSSPEHKDSNFIGILPSRLPTKVAKIVPLQ